MKNCGKNCVSYTYVSKYGTKGPYISLKELIKLLLISPSTLWRQLFNVNICQGCKEKYIGEMGCLVKERIKYLQKTDHAAVVSTIDTWRTLVK